MCPFLFEARISMNWIAVTALVLQMLLLLYVAMIDVAARVIPDGICLTLALIGMAGALLGDPTHLAESLVAATVCFCC